MHEPDSLATTGVRLIGGISGTGEEHTLVLEKNRPYLPCRSLVDPATPATGNCPAGSADRFPSRNDSPDKKNKPVSGSFSRFPVRAMPGHPCKIAGFCSSGEYARIAPHLPKYGRFTPRQMAINGLWTVPVSATYFSPSGPRKSHRNANMRLIFSGGGLKKGKYRKTSIKKERFNKRTFFLRIAH